jgi:hypothetical protein
VRHQLTILDAMVVVAAAALGTWVAAAYKAGFPLPIIARPGVPLFPLVLSVPVAVALTCGLLAVPVRTLRARACRITRQPGTALCAGAAAAFLGVVVRWLLGAWFFPYVDGSSWKYGPRIPYESASWCGLGVLATLGVLALGGRVRYVGGTNEWMRLALAGYWLVVFVIFSVL